MSMENPCKPEMVTYYDQLLHQSLTELFRNRCLDTKDQIEEFLRAPENTNDQDYRLKKILLEQEPELSEHFRYFTEDLLMRPLLWIAVIRGYLDSAELLVRSGADVNQTAVFKKFRPDRPDCKSTILHFLTWYKCLPQGLDLPDSQSKVDRLIHLVIDHGADLQVCGISGTKGNLLHVVIENDSIDMLKFFLEKRVDVNVVNAYGMTPLLYAAYISSKADTIMPLLIKHGADIFAKDKLIGQNVLHLMTYRGEYVDLAKQFIEMGVSVHDGTTNYNLQPAHLAAGKGKNELLKLFLDHGANVNARSKGGQTPLCIAAKPICTALVVLETLIKRGATVNLPCNTGGTPLHYACRFYNEEKIRLLVSAGADMLVEDCNGKRPFDLIDRQNSKNPSTELVTAELEALCLS